MSRPYILLLGAGGHARACIDVIEQAGEYAVAGLVGLASEIGSTILGYPVLGTDLDLPQLLETYRCALITIGQIKTPEPRMRLFEILEKKNCATPTIISPRAYVSPHARVGAGTIVMHGAVVNAGAVVGCNCILNSLSLIEHDVTISDHCHISTSAAVNSGVFVGRGTFIGSGSSVRQGTHIAENCLIGMGQRVLNNCIPGTTIPSLKGSS